MLVVREIKGYFWNFLSPIAGACLTYALEEVIIHWLQPSSTYMPSLGRDDFFILSPQKTDGRWDALNRGAFLWTEIQSSTQISLWRSNPPPRRVLWPAAMNKAQTESLHPICLASGTGKHERSLNAKDMRFTSELYGAWSLRGNKTVRKRGMGMGMGFMNCLLGFGTWILSKLPFSY